MGESKARTIVDWITVNGNHVPVFEGETTEDAVKRFTKVSESESKKESQIAQNKAQADKLNEEEKASAPPRRLYLNDISAEDANKGSDVLNLRTKQRYKFADGTKITQVHVFAGNGCSKTFNDAEKYAKRYSADSSDPKKWQHVSGIAKITNGSQVLEREVHWVQAKDGRIREAFIKFHEH
jgi:hypothetical protein